ncbi:MAG: TIGR00269 family protein [Thermoplasmata archaeon]
MIDQPYAGAHRCERHFLRSVDERVRREFHDQLPRFSGGTIGVALSGGKDSAVALQQTQRYFGRRPNVRLIALSVDEGVAGYRSRTLEAARQLTQSLGVEHRVLAARDELGTTTDEAARALPSTIPCSFCGVWRRRLLNDLATREGAGVLVLGFNLDDLAQTILMNLARGDLGRLARMAPHRSRQPGLVPRIAPLADVPEREVVLYARLRGLAFDHGECPHAPRAARNAYREAIWRLEEEVPGTRHALRRTHRRLTDLGLLENAGAPGRCWTCGAPAAHERCRACEYLVSVRAARTLSAPEAP